MKHRRSILMLLILLLLLLTPLVAAVPFGTRWEVCEDNNDRSSGTGICVMVRKLAPYAIWVVRYEDNDRSGSFHPAYDTIIASNMTFTERKVTCGEATALP